MQRKLLRGDYFYGNTTAFVAITYIATETCLVAIIRFATKILRCDRSYGNTIGFVEINYIAMETYVVAIIRFATDNI